jgi:hypothetical protein
MLVRSLRQVTKIAIVWTIGIIVVVVGAILVRQPDDTLAGGGRALRSTARLRCLA